MTISGVFPSRRLSTSVQFSLENLKVNGEQVSVDH